MQKNINKLIIIYFIVAAFISCTSVKKAKKVLNNNPYDAALYCAEKFPIKDTTYFIEGIVRDTVTDFIETVKYDTTTLKDTVVKTIIKTNLVIKIKVDTLIKFRENTARIEAKEYEMQQLKSSFNYITKEAEKWEARSKQNMKWLLILLGIVGVGIFLKIKKII